MEQDSKKQKLSEFIIDYLGILHDCLNNTNFADDRSSFKGSIVNVSFWLVELKTKSFTDMSEIILDSQTDKIILDTWKSGEWGEKEAHGLITLQKNIRSIV
jgi:hypothetical protein